MRIEPANSASYSSFSANGRTAGESANAFQRAAATQRQRHVSGTSAPASGSNSSQGTGPNHYSRKTTGPKPELDVGGTHEQQQAQRDETTRLAAMAMSSYTTGNHLLPSPASNLPRVPTDSSVAKVLDGLPFNPPTTAGGGKITNTVYRSDIPNATPEQAYQHFVKHPGQVFSAGGIEVRPKTGRLTDGGRYMLEIGTPGPMWLPVQIDLDPANHAITIRTLQGHVLRGEQTFTFSNDRQGGTRLEQDAHFQASSKLPGKAQQLASIAQGQHDTWEHAHREIYEQFNGDKGYQGMGTKPLNPHQLQEWGKDALNVLLHPGDSVDTAYDSAGILENSMIDQGGQSVGRFMDNNNVPGGNWIRNGTDKVGDGVEWVEDKRGDLAEFAVDSVLPW